MQTNSTDICSQWIARARSPQTARNYAQSLKRWNDSGMPPIGGDVTEADLTRFLRSMVSLAESTQGNHLKNIKALLRWGHDEGYWLCPPSVRRFRIQRQRSAASSRYLSPEHARAIIAAATCERDRLILQCLFSLGLRNAELRGLRWEDLHYDRLKVHGKGSKVRSLKVPQKLLEQLNLWRMASSGKGLMFRTHRSQSKLDGRDVWKAVKDAAAIARKNDPSIPDASPHWFRHALATAVIRNGMDMKEVQHYLGHASGQTTMDTYAHARGDVAIADFV